MTNSAWEPPPREVRAEGALRFLQCGQGFLQHHQSSILGLVCHVCTLEDPWQHVVWSFPVPHTLTGMLWAALEVDSSINGFELENNVFELKGSGVRWDIGRNCSL